ncbi:hypothetical protein GKZ28_21710 [Clostridium chromiireducens]|uniref:Uncharacterized protein n=1 Tax=Clostridium chromiireducens TaxID=225345 RepID=A0A964RRJ8_9CLOT|nr:hypothetical protein [Clostridium chromiireducens]MVX66298.1 hypothetical protein [Clostridium chromiireducens]
MFIYILNLLNDGLKKIKGSNCERSTSEIINDTKYISQLACIKKGLDFVEVNARIAEVIQILSKYNLTGGEKLDILGKLVKNKSNNWIFEKLNSKMSLEENSEFNLYTLINNVTPFENCADNIFNIGMEENAIYNNTCLPSYLNDFKAGTNLKLINKKYNNPKENNNSTDGYSRIVVSNRGQEKPYDLTKRIRQARYEKDKETRTNGNRYYESFITDSERSLIKITI